MMGQGPRPPCPAMFLLLLYPFKSAMIVNDLDVPGVPKHDRMVLRGMVPVRARPEITAPIETRTTRIARTCLVWMVRDLASSSCMKQRRYVNC